MILCWILVIGALGQEQSIDGQKARVAPVAADAGCAQRTAILDEALYRHRDSETFIFVARLGSRERDGTWSQRRLHNIKLYCTEWGLAESKLITAIGDSASGPGRVEVYASGRLIAIIEALQNKDIRISRGCEGGVEGYYPHRDFVLKHRHREGAASGKPRT
jgi:hypothetical protein